MKWENLRFTLVLSFLCFSYIAVIARLFVWQVFRASELSDLGRAQSSQVLTIPAIRGEIKAKDDFPLAANAISYLLYANPKVIKDKEDYVKKLEGILENDPASISAKLSSDLYWVKLSVGLDQDKKHLIEKLSLKGIGFQQEYTRFYPEASMAAHLIGFLGKDSKGENKGYFGVEGRYNTQLSGRSGKLYAIRDALGNQVLGDTREDKKIDGRGVKLTLDRTVQFAVEKRLKDGIERYNADGGSVVIMESKTGAILAMSAVPSFNPEKYYEFDLNSYTNPVLSNLYEPGSTFKVLVMAAAVDEGKVKPETRCNICAGPITEGDYTIRTWNDKYFPNTTMRDVIVNSNNTGMVFVGRKLGLSSMIKYLEKFGIGKITGIDLQGEETGVIRDENSWYPIDLATASFGQGISITPIQLLNAVNAVANRGNLMTPYVVSQIISDDGKKIDIISKIKRRVIKESTSKIITDMMVSAVEEGEAKWTKIKNYKIAGKTGTAQIPVAGHYDPNQTIASFVGFFPASDPKITMLVLVDRPKTSIYGSETAAPIFFNIARDLIKYYNLPSN
ncbi:MAG: penicillin-binding protein 2 [Candidatus Levybacteria bacterium]|nr:penicillin-binding protein 2 [Candidatus Levybacteria bacterium]